MPVRLYNSLTRRKEEFVPLDPAGRIVRFYSCGPTVYGPFHIGNARAFVAMDLVRRWLVYRGYDVRYVQNITDVDDKIIERAAREGTTPESVAATYTALFFEHLKLLGNLPADRYPKATEFVPRMIEAIGELIRRGHAYASADGSVWFSVSSFPEYGKLSRKPLDQMMEGERVDATQQQLKRSPLDFALWKASKPGEPAWQAPWGAGRPGWHIECSCMSIDCLGSPTIDIHGGGIDLQFPHHENEIAQSEAWTGQAPFARYWLHNGFLNIDGRKMSKSLNNFLRMDEVLARMDGLSVRRFLIGGQYRQEMDLSDDSIHAATAWARKLAKTTHDARGYLESRGAQVSGPMDGELAAILADFEAAMDDDINTPVALAAMSELIRVMNLRREAAESASSTATDTALAGALGLLVRLREVLGLSPELEPQHAASTPEGDPFVAPLVALITSLAEAESTPADLASGLREGLSALGSAPDRGALLALLIDTRARAKKAKQYALGDAIRARLREAGFALEDRRDGRTVAVPVETSA